MSEKGYVYVLTNPSFKEDWVKIGKSKREPEVRGKQLYNTAVPLPYEIYATLKTTKYNEAEKLIHRSIDRISNLRIASNREFFNIAPEKAYEILCDVALLLDDAEIQLYGDNVDVHEILKTSRKRTGQLFDFYSRGLKDGDVIHFCDDDKITVVVANSRQVLFEGQLWYLSALTRELYTRMNKVNQSGAYQGPMYFKYQNEFVGNLPVIINKEIEDK